MTNELIEAMRESFDAWFSDDWQYPNAVERDAVGYKLAQTQNAWTAWQAAWQAAIAALQREQWIPVSERLPPECVDVLVLHDYGQIVGNPAHRDYGKRYRYKITRRYGNEFLSDLMETGQATHWMPLPEAPQTVTAGHPSYFSRNPK